MEHISKEQYHTQTAENAEKLPRGEYDSPWKDMLERYFKEFTAFFFPKVHRGIDWTVGYQFLDKELQQVVRDAEHGQRIVDKLVRVRSKRGKETWVLVHVEIQGQPVQEFEKRMYVYNYRLFDRYDRPVCSLAVLADEQASWLPKQFHYAIWGCDVRLKFPVVKLLNYGERFDELETNTNPFAIVVFAYLKTLETKDAPETRMQWKSRCYRLLYERGYSKSDIFELMRFIDWVMVLPKELEQRFENTISEYEEEHKMRYITSHERIGFEKGIQEGIQQGMQQGLQQGRDLGIIEKSQEAVITILQARFSLVPETITYSLKKNYRQNVLDRLLKEAVTTSSIEDFQNVLEREKVEIPVIPHA